MPSSPCSTPTIILRRHSVAQEPRFQPLQRQRALDSLRADQSRISVRTHHTLLPVEMRLFMQSHACERRPLANRGGSAAGRNLERNAFIGPFPAAITALTGLEVLYSPALVPLQHQLRLLSCDGTLWHRNLGSNRFSGSVPSTVSVLTALTYL
jgi:hypothetical protein